MTASVRLVADVAASLRAAGCVFATDEARLLIEASASPDELASLVSQRVAGVPVEHLLGWAQFCGLRIAVGRGVFVPRQRTELVVHEAARLLRLSGSRVVVDLCCGSGAVGCAIESLVGGVELHAVDLDADAVACARGNVSSSERVYLGDLYSALPGSLRGAVVVVVANAPYVPTDDIGLMPPEARDHERRIALDGGVDGLDVQRRIIAGAAAWLVPGGHLIVETSARQATASHALFVAAGFNAHVVTRDDLDATVVVGRVG